MEIEDDGVGFNVGAVDATYAQRGSLGMVSMRQRIELLGGSLTVDWSKGGARGAADRSPGTRRWRGAGALAEQVTSERSFLDRPPVVPPSFLRAEVAYASTAKGKEDRQDLRRRLDNPVGARQ